MGRIMAMDYGTKRVGLAVTDPLRLIATGLDTVHPNDLLAYLETYFAKEEVDVLVVGAPRRMDNTASAVEPHIVGAIRKIQSRFPQLSITRQDERFTSKMAMHTMITGGLKKSDRQNKALVDKVSATIILQSYLDQPPLS